MRAAITTPSEGQGAILDFLMDRIAAVPDDVRDKLREWSDPRKAISPVECTVNACEMIFARRDELPVELLSIGAELSDVCDRFNLGGMKGNGRALGIGTALRDMPGVIPAAPVEPQATPEPLAEFAKPTEPPIPPEALPAPPEGAARVQDGDGGGGKD